MGLAFQMMVIIALGAFAGQYLDAYMQNKQPWMTIVLSLFAIFSSLYMVFKSISE
jgi:F0F1-type ATP synthase assembly protein I